MTDEDHPFNPRIPRFINGVLDQGRIQQGGTPKELLFRPKNELVRSFFRAQQLRLGLEVVTLKDIMKPGEASDTGKIADNVPRIDESASVFEALDRLPKKDSPLVIQGKEVDVVTDRYQILRSFLEIQAG